MAEEKKDFWDIVSSVSTLISTVILGAVGLFYTITVKDVRDEQDKTAQRQLEQNRLQFDRQSEAWKESDASRERAWKEEQDRLADAEKKEIRPFGTSNCKTANYSPYYRFQIFCLIRTKAPAEPSWQVHNLWATRT
jgi:hypothetical protein